MTDGTKVSALATATPSRADVLYVVTPGSEQLTLGAALTLALDTDLTFSDNTTGDVSTSKHGYFPKLPSGVVSALLAVTKYGPAQAVVSTTSTTLTAIDTTNLSITFTAPSTGKVILRLSAYADVSSSAQQYFWGVLDGSSALVSGVAVGPCRDNLGITMTGHCLITGLTPGTAYTWRWAHAVTGGATGRIGFGPGLTSTTVTTAMWGPALMEVWAA